MSARFVAVLGVVVLTTLLARSNLHPTRCSLASITWCSRRPISNVGSTRSSSNSA